MWYISNTMVSIVRIFGNVDSQIETEGSTVTSDDEEQQKLSGKLN